MKLSKKLSTGREKNENTIHKHKIVRKSMHTELFPFKVVHTNATKQEKADLSSLVLKLEKKKQYCSNEQQFAKR